ncbi:MAG: TetR/AcrR family transcriptional regulator [Myxococcota bacterium]
MSPRAKTPRPPGDMRDHLLDAALRAFATSGYEATSIRRIADEAKVASGLLYHYFPSKEALLQALFEQNQARVAAPFAHIAALTDPRAQLGKLLRVSADIVRQNPDFWRVTYGVRFQPGILAGLGEGVRAWNATLLAAFGGLLTAIGRPGPEVEAALLFAALDGIFQHYVLDLEGYPLDAVVGSLIAHFGGIEPPPISEAT